MIYYISIYCHLLHFPFLPFTTIYYSFYYIIYYNLQLGNIYYHLFHLFQMVFFIYYYLLFPGQLGDGIHIYKVIQT